MSLPIVHSANALERRGFAAARGDRGPAPAGVRKVKSNGRRDP